MSRPKPVKKATAKPEELSAEAAVAPRSSEAAEDAMDDGW